MKHRQKSLRKRKVVEKFYRLAGEIFHATNDFERINQSLKRLIDSAEQSERELRGLYIQSQKINQEDL